MNATTAPRLLTTKTQNVDPDVAIVLDLLSGAKPVSVPAAIREQLTAWCVTTEAAFGTRWELRDLGVLLPKGTRVEAILTPDGDWLTDRNLPSQATLDALTKAEPGAPVSVLEYRDFAGNLVASPVGLRLHYTLTELRPASAGYALRGEANIAHLAEYITADRPDGTVVVVKDRNGISD